MAPLMGSHPLDLHNKVLEMVVPGSFIAAPGMGPEQQEETVYIATSSRH